METKVKFKGITPKVKDEEEIFILRFEVHCDDWDESLDVKEVVEKKLQNILNNQKQLGDEEDDKSQ